jgi:hypothetical protein
MPTNNSRHSLLVFTMLIAMLSLPPAFVCSAQESKEADVSASIKKSNGVETVEFDTLVGTVEVNFPDDMSDTDTISGTVLVEPKGETKEEKVQNEDTLRGYVVEIEKTVEIAEPPPPVKTAGGVRPPTTKFPPTCPPRTQTRNYPPTCPPRTPKYPPPCPPGSMTRNSGGTCPQSTGEPPYIYVVPGCRGGFTAGIPPKCGGVNVVVKNANGTPICSLPVPTNPVPPKTPPGCKFPATCVSGGPICIPGKTDGRSSTSTVKINGRTCEPICESPRQTVAQTPAGLNGPCTVTVTECGQTTRGTVTMRPPICTLPPPKKPEEGKSPTFVFRRTGPFVDIKEDSFEAIKNGYKATVTDNQIIFVGPYSYYANGNLMHDFAKATITFTPPPERITTGDEFSLSASVSGDKNYLEVPYAGPRGNYNSDCFWVMPNASTIPQLNLDPGRNESTSITHPFKVSDRPIQLRKMFEQQYKGNIPEQAKAQLTEMENRQPKISVYGLSGVRVLVEWVYVREGPQRTCGFNEARKRQR